MDALLSFDIGLHIEDAPVSLEEARRLIESAEGLALIKNRWVAVDPEKLRQTLDAYEKARALAEREGLTFRDALRFQMNPGAVLDLAGSDAAVTVTSGQWLESVMAKMRHPAMIAPVKLAPVLQGGTEALPGKRRELALLSALPEVRHVPCRRHGPRQDRAGAGAASPVEAQGRERREPCRDPRFASRQLGERDHEVRAGHQVLHGPSCRERFPQRGGERGARAGQTRPRDHDLLDGAEVRVASDHTSGST